MKLSTKKVSEIIVNLRGQLSPSSDEKKRQWLKSQGQNIPKSKEEIGSCTSNLLTAAVGVK